MYQDMNIYCGDEDCQLVDLNLNFLGKPKQHIHPSWRNHIKSKHSCIDMY
jgi:hypothetical protein